MNEKTESNRERRERGEKKSPNEDKYVCICIEGFLTFIQRRKKEEKKPVRFMTEQVRMVPKYYLSLCLHMNDGIGFLLFFPITSTDR